MQPQFLKRDHESRSSLIVSLSGWIILLVYLYYSYSKYEADLLTLILSPRDYAQTVWTLLAFFAPLLTTIMGFVLNNRITLYRQLSIMEDQYKSMAAKDLQEMIDDLIFAFANALDAKSHWTKGHSERVAEYALNIAKKMNVEHTQLDILRKAALLHDIGKLGTYDVLLDKAEKLTPDEFELVKKHPAKGVEILSPIRRLNIILPIIRHHHERMDGTGYPDGLKGEEIPLLARIVTVADCFDAMVEERPYKKALSREEAVKDLQKNAGVRYDPTVVQAFLQIIGSDDSDSRLTSTSSNENLSVNAIHLTAQSGK